MSIINNALSGALAAQAGVTVTSQNVANLQTPGYTRQGVILTAAQASGRGPAATGDGVNVPSLFRFSDAYKSLQMWNAASDVGQHTTADPYLKQLEQVMGDDTSNINRGLDGFSSALNAASVDPTSSPLRQQVISAAEGLSQRFASLSQVLLGQKESVHQQRSAIATQVGNLATDIARLNDKIAAASGYGTSASGLIDERDKKIDALSSLVGIQTVNQADGSRSVSMRGGQPLVIGSKVAQVTVQPVVGGGQKLVVQLDQQSFGVSGSNLGGELGGLADIEDKVLTPLNASIQDLAKGISSQFNAQLAAGFTMAGSAGQPLFDVASSALGVLKVSSGLQPADLGFSSDAAQPGDSANLLKVIDLKKQSLTVTSLGSVQMGDAYTQLVSKLAGDSQQNSASLTVAQTVRTYAVSDWKSVSGVNSDEEAINLVQFQQMYQANMKVISVANQLFDSTLAIIN
jgi:flagellar hook-associated protein 1